MTRIFFKAFQKITAIILFVRRSVKYLERVLINQGRILTNQQLDMNDGEFSISSQFEKDGIIQCLVKSIEVENTLFIEFGVEDEGILIVKRKLASPAIKFNGLLKRNGNLLVIKNECLFMSQFRLFPAYVNFVFKL